MHCWQGGSSSIFYQKNQTCNIWVGDDPETAEALAGSTFPITAAQLSEGLSAAGPGAPLLPCGAWDRELEPCISIPALTAKQVASLGH